jgi:hypothetical protein
MSEEKRAEKTETVPAGFTAAVREYFRLMGDATSGGEPDWDVQAAEAEDKLRAMLPKEEE